MTVSITLCLEYASKRKTLCVVTFSLLSTRSEANSVQTERPRTSAANECLSLPEETFQVLCTVPTYTIRDVPVLN
jgi:hypothetical protein